VVFRPSQTLLQRRKKQRRALDFSQKYTRSTKTNIDRLKKAFGNFRDVLGDYFIIFYEKVLKPLGKWVMNKLAPLVIDMLAAAFQFLAEVLKFLKPIFVWLLDNVIVPLAKRIGKWLWTDSKISHLPLSSWARR
jgi:hypothetical protein